jgi:hypothetical protein
MLPRGVLPLGAKKSRAGPAITSRTVTRRLFPLNAIWTRVPRWRLDNHLMVLGGGLSVLIILCMHEDLTYNFHSAIGL